MLSLPCFNRLRLSWNCAFWIDDNIHWALIDLFCDTFFCLQDYWVFRACSRLACYFCFLNLNAILCLKETLGLDWVWFFGDLKLRIFFTLLSVRCFNWLRLWWDCASWIDDNMHWALIDLFCDTFFVYKTIEFSAVALAWLASAALKKLHAILCLKETIGFDWVWFFGDINLRIFFTLLSVRCFIDCNLDETVLFELMITCTWLWLTCFVILFLYTRLLSFRGCSRLACYFCFEKVTCNFVPQGNAWPWLSLIFWRPKTSHFLDFALCSVF